MSRFSASLQRWMDEHALDARLQTYRIDNFVLVNNGVVRDGGTGADHLTGGARGDLIWGGDGNDVLRGERGNDLLNGGAGDDVLYGGVGNDRLQGQGGDDWLFGGNGNDALYGGTGNDRLYGDKGNDFLCAGSGFDMLWGGRGRDTFVFRPEVDAPPSQSTYMDFSMRDDRLRIEADLVPQGVQRSMFGVEADGDLILSVEGGHRMVFETLDARHIDALMARIEII
jgi:Ca2+-binding RTX toxin-like protein